MDVSNNIVGFKEGKPVWLKDRQKVMNLQAGFKCSFKANKKSKYILKITGSTLYRIYVNGNFVHYGPARAAHGYVRIDEISLDAYISEGINSVAIEVAGYNCGTYYTLNIPSFLQMEITEDDKVICSTGENCCVKGVELTTRVRKAVRYSFQRSFSEIYHLDNNDELTNWVTNNSLNMEELETVDINLKYLPREVPVPKYELKQFRDIVEAGEVSRRWDKENIKYIRHRFIHKVPDLTQGYRHDEIDEHPFEVLQECTFKKDENNLCKTQGGSICISEGSYVLFDMGVNNVGFITAEIIAEEDSEVYLVFDEKLIDGKIDISTWSWVNIIKYTFKKNSKPYRIESFECYGFKYLQCMVLKGSIKLALLGLREYSYPNYRNTEFKCSDEKINKIFEAAVQTYRQNTLDVFMDCPTRERAGWLCDSYFTAQSAHYFSGEAIVEKVMLENFVLADKFPCIPEGMLPMCYPADHQDGNFIPQWAMWYVIELDQYFKRNKDADKKTFEPLCRRLVEYFQKFRNSDGLLERLEKWCFVEWSDANKWVQDVNYPTNMLYSKMLRLIGTWYNDDALLKEAEKVKQEIIKQSFDGTCFIDNAIRSSDGVLELTGNRSEVCQYYAFFFDIADPEDERFAKLKDLVLNVFGPYRKAKGIMPEIAYANAFIGNYLRMELLLRWGRYEKVLEECKGYFYKMAETTGTLWEHDSISGSLNHGFASFIGAGIVKCLLGIKNIDLRNNTVEFDFSYCDMEAFGKVGTPLGDIVVERKFENGKLKTKYSVPEGLKCRVIE